MAAKKLASSAGLLAYRIRDGRLEVLLVHPGGPFWKNKDLGAWTIPKGEVDDTEEPLDAAVREFSEETGFESCGPYVPLGSIRQKSGKIVQAWAFRSPDPGCDVKKLRSNLFQVEWPPRSGRQAEFPEVDRAEWFSLEEARKKANPAQISLFDALATTLGTGLE